MKQPLAVIILLILAAASAPVPARAAEPLRLYVNSHAFDVAVAPVDEESAAAESSVLYERRGAGGEWREAGDCDRTVRPDGAVRFVGEVDVTADGTYHYTSVAVVGGRVASAPAAGESPQAVVVVDTLPPTATLVSPEADVTANPGEVVPLAWTTTDENFGEAPATLAFSTDGGKSWRVIEGNLPPEGKADWTVPEDAGGAAVVRVAAVDRAGNVGRAVRGMEIAAAPATAVQPEPAAVAAASEKQTPRDPNRSWLYYLMAINNMRQSKPAEALRYYWLSVKEDPEFVDAWADIALAYIDLGAYKTAREVAEKARDIAPERVDLLHLLAETYHAEGMAELTEAKDGTDRARAKGLIDQAVDWYGRALAEAADGWRLAEQAASYYRLGEICYYVNLDPDGARAYWQKILSLHVPTPNLDLVLWSAPAEQPRARQRHQRDTNQRVILDAWQGWARGYLRQLDERERAGIRDLMPAQRISAAGRAATLSYAGNGMNPGAADGRSLFSLPDELAGEAPAAPAVVRTPARPPAADYSFYASSEGNGPDEAFTVTPSRRGRQRSAFSGGPDAPPPPNPDPYAFPGRRERAGWNEAGTYGDRPVTDW